MKGDAANQKIIESTLPIVKADDRQRGGRNAVAGIITHATWHNTFAPGFEQATSGVIPESGSVVLWSPISTTGNRANEEAIFGEADCYFARRIIQATLMFPGG